MLDALSAIVFCWIVCCLLLTHHPGAFALHSALSQERKPVTKCSGIPFPLYSRVDSVKQRLLNFTGRLKRRIGNSSLQQLQKKMMAHVESEEAPEWFFL